MATAKATLIGLYSLDRSLFDNMQLPDGIDKDLVVNNLMVRSGEFEVLHFDPEYMKFSIGVWSGKWYRTFAEWLRGTKATWNPIHNYDRFEESSDTHSHKTTADYSDARTADLKDERTADIAEQRTADLTDQRTANLTDKRTADLSEQTTLNHADSTAQLTSAQTDHSVAAYDNNNFVPSSRDVVNNGTTNVSHTGTVTVGTTGTDTNTTTGTDTNKTTGTDTTVTSGTDTYQHTGTDTTQHSGTLEDTNGSDTHRAHLYGNIGVTQSSEMLKAFYDISTWNLYDHIADVFTQELLIPVY